VHQAIPAQWRKAFISHKNGISVETKNILDARCLGVNRFAPERIQSLVERKVVGVDLPCGRRKKDVLAVLTGLISV
jgi:hypothetical protein